MAVQLNLEGKAAKPAQKTLDGRLVEWSRCNYPGCNSRPVAVLRGVSLCAKHLELAEFIDWWCAVKFAVASINGQEAGTTE